MRVALIGATGLVGSFLVARLAAAGHEVHALQRQAGGDAANKHVADASRWPAIVRELAPDVAISALGTTMKRAGSEAAFAAVDRDMVIAFAKAARQTEALRLVTISSVGADVASRNFYLRIKGEVEQSVASLGFRRVDILRPGLLRGQRGPDRRLGERLGILVSPVVNLALCGRLDRYAAIDASIVAAAIAASLEEVGSGTYVHHNREIAALARG